MKNKRETPKIILAVVGIIAMSVLVILFGQFETTGAISARGCTNIVSYPDGALWSIGTDEGYTTGCCGESGVLADPDASKGLTRACQHKLDECGSYLPAEQCDDGIDNDCDGLTDCSDKDCNMASGDGVCCPNENDYCDTDCAPEKDPDCCIDADGDGYLGTPAGCGPDCDDTDPKVGIAKLLKEWGRYGYGNGEFRYPRGIAVDSKGYVYVADTKNNRIQKFYPSGGFIKSWKGVDEPYGVAVDSGNNIYVIEYSTSYVKKFTSSGNLIKSWSTGFWARGIAIDSNNYVYVVGLSPSYVKKFDSGGNLIKQWYVGGNPLGIAIDSADNVYVTDLANHRVRKYKSNGAPITSWNIYKPRETAIDPADYVYVVQGGPSSKYQIRAFTSGGVFKGKWSRSYASSLAADPRGTSHLYVTLREGHKVQKFKVCL